MGEQRMRIVGGTLKGRRLVAPKGEGTRPTSDRVREALMSSLVNRLGADLGGGVALDMFAGSGALALEALSRGVSRAVLVERDKGALRAIAENVAALRVEDRVKVIEGDTIGSAGTRIAASGPYTLLFCDPPYRIDQKRVAARLVALGDSGAIAEGAALAWEHGAGGAVPEPEGFAQERTYRYGDTALTLLRYYGKGRVE
jgi:16S rRNA (guanine(966)-N(2))-methyltransferase RsmD